MSTEKKDYFNSHSFLLVLLSDFFKSFLKNFYEKENMSRKKLEQNVHKNLRWEKSLTEQEV